MHRPGIADIDGSRIILRGTTIEEVEKYHRDTLMICIDEANMKTNIHLQKRMLEEESREKKKTDHANTVANVASRIKFD